MIPLNRAYINSLQSNFSKGIGHDQESLKSILLGDNNSTKFDNHLFQILIFENEEEEAKLVIDTKENLEGFLGSSNTNKSTNNFDSFERFPSLGAKVNQDFLNQLSKGVPDIDQAERCTVRFLKQTRLLSQLMAAVWLDEIERPDDYKNEIKYARRILREHDIIPKPYHINDGTNLTEIPDLTKYINDQVGNKNQDLFLIKPEYISYTSIPLSLLLCGQAYYVDKTDGTTLKRVWKPIYSTYEMVYEYALDLSWDTFYATRVDIFQPGAKPNPPYTKVTLGYPPKPITSKEDKTPDLTQKDLQDWFMAEEIRTTGEAQDAKKWPFYPDKDSDSKFTDDKLQFVMPPIPYIPLSTV